MLLLCLSSCTQINRQEKLKYTCCPSHSVLQNSDLKNVHKRKCSSLSFHYQKIHYSRRKLRLKLNEVFSFIVYYNLQKCKHWKKIKIEFQPFTYILNIFKCTRQSVDTNNLYHQLFFFQ